GLDPKSTAMLFAKAERLADKKIGDEECFVLKVCAGKDDVMARNYGPGHIAVEVLRHVLYGYFSQKSGLLVYMEDSQLTRAMVENDTDSSFSSDDEKMEEVMYWETSIGSSIGDYREVEGLMVAHQGRSIATVFEVQQPYMYRTRFEELWKIDDIAFNIPGLSSHSFLPPSH
ncbi:C-type mannose receptor 2, partial [Tanacetum coccineum]